MIAERYVSALKKPKSSKNDWRTDKAVIGNGVCPYCGKSVKKRGETYCQHCRMEGFDNVHLMFGKTNGWDKRPIRVVPTRVGWRGREVSGCKTRRTYGD